VENIQLIQTDDGSSSLFNVALQETYHSRHGAIQESAHVFIKNGLQFFTEKKNTVPVSVFEVGFGTGLNALLALLFSEENKISVDYTSIEASPIDWEVASHLNYSQQLGGSIPDYFQRLHQTEWSKKINITESFSLHKIKSSIQDFEFNSDQFDVIFFDAFAPTKQPEMWELPVLEKIVSGMKPEGILVTYCAKGQVKRDLKFLGTTVESLPGPPGKREMVRANKPPLPWRSNFSSA
jgi:tRNA U34 5-methylaminomethyl-2-thiouridine-forming methyltransferase MnmC